MAGVCQYAGFVPKAFYRRARAPEASKRGEQHSPTSPNFYGLHNWGRGTPLTCERVMEGAYEHCLSNPATW